MASSSSESLPVTTLSGFVRSLIRNDVRPQGDRQISRTDLPKQTIRQAGGMSGSDPMLPKASVQHSGSAERDLKDRSEL